MKNKPSLQKTTGFTLVELLVVIVIIVSLAAIAFTVGPRMKKRADAAKSIQNIGQIGSLLAVYSAENSANLPAIKALTLDANGNQQEINWDTALLALAYPDVQIPMFSNSNWWNSVRPMMRNPLLEKTRFQPWFHGYAMNYSLSVNASPGATGAFGSGAGSDSLPVPLSRIPDPSRTPVVSTTRNWFYRAADLTALTKSSSADKSLLIDGKLPVLFVDGHVESITPADYVARNLGSMPKKP